MYERVLVIGIHSMGRVGWEAIMNALSMNYLSKDLDGQTSNKNAEKGFSQKGKIMLHDLQCSL